MSLERGAEKAAERAAARGIRVKKPKTTPMIPEPNLGERGSSPREVDVGERFTAPSGVQKDVVRDPTTGQVAGLQDVPSGPDIRQKRKASDDQIDAAQKSARKRKNEIQQKKN